MINDRQGMDMYVQKLKNVCPSQNIKDTNKSFVDCMFTKLKNIEFLITFQKFFMFIS